NPYRPAIGSRRATRCRTTSRRTRAGTVLIHISCNWLRHSDRIGPECRRGDATALVRASPREFRHAPRPGHVYTDPVAIWLRALRDRDTADAGWTLSSFP